MKKIIAIVCCLIPFVFASDLSEIHPGLKSAIDAGNLQLAENLIN